MKSIAKGKVKQIQLRSFKPRDYRVYAYVTKDIAEWLEKETEKNGMSFASYVFSALNFTYTHKDEFDAKESFFNV